jgi:hypothetical protein
MGVELRPVFQPLLSGLVYQAEGKAVVDDLDALEAIAAEHRITPLSAFMDPRQPPEDFEPDEDFDGDPETYLDQACGPWTDWFPALEGWRSVRGLLDALQDSMTRDRLSDGETVVDDLEELARCLEVAVRRKARFRFAVG